tara:strand:- start:3513 stop:4373 length:861 start_codon:yes stop_codon:yes gene_type:complete
MNAEQQIADLQAQIESAKAKIAQLKAGMQEVKAEEAEIKKKSFAEVAQDRNLQGNRDADGNFLPENTSGKPMELKPDLGEGSVSSATRKRTKEEEEIYKALMEGEELTDEQYEITNQMSIEDFEATGIPLVGQKIFTEGEDDELLKVKIKGNTDQMEDVIEGDQRTDEESAKRKFAGVEQATDYYGGDTELDGGRTFAEEDESVERTMGFETSESGIMSVDEKDDYWKTQEGHDKALEMYGRKPAWIKEPTLQWNPEEQKYEKIEEEEFEDLSSPAMSADVKNLFG